MLLLKSAYSSCRKISGVIEAAYFTRQMLLQLPNQTRQTSQVHHYISVNE